LPGIRRKTCERDVVQDEFSDLMAGSAIPEDDTPVMPAKGCQPSAIGAQSRHIVSIWRPNLSSLAGFTIDYFRLAKARDDQAAPFGARRTVAWKNAGRKRLGWTHAQVTRVVAHRRPAMQAAVASGNQLATPGSKENGLGEFQLQAGQLPAENQ